MAYQNFFAAKLQNDIGAADTTITLDTAPSATSGRMVLEARNPTQREIIKYTGVSGTQLTGVTRGQGGTTAKSHTKNSLVEMNLTAQDIQDLYDAFASFAAVNNDWRLLPYTVGTPTPLGNRSYSVPISGVDITPIVSEGMRVKMTRTVAASNTSFLLDGTNDYYVKTSPNKMLWTDDFAVGFWIYPTAYPTSFAGIASRYNGTSGWEFLIDSKGCVILIGHNAGSGNFRGVTSYQSVPLNKWTFVSAQLDMSAHTATTTTSYVMLDGIDVPSYVSQAGTNPTSLVQAGNFEIGSTNGGTNPFTGYIGDGGVFSAKVTQATMLGYMNQKLTGSETNLASGYANGSVNDLNTTTPNNLTATNGATTVANAPYGDRGVSTTVDYGVIMKKSFSTDTTLTIQVPEGCTIPTSGGVSSMDYSISAVPYGFPRDKGRWRLSTLLLTTYSKSVGSTTAWYVSPIKLSVPIGAWSLGYSAQSRVGGTTGAAAVNGHVALTTNSADYTTTTVPPDELRRTSWLYAYGTGTTMIQTAGSLYNATEQLLSASTTYSLSGNTSEAAGGFIFELYYGTEIFAENQYI